jgi:hypothetical protein
MFNQPWQLVFLSMGLFLPSLTVLPAEPGIKTKEPDFKQLEEKSGNGEIIKRTATSRRLK